MWFGSDEARNLLSYKFRIRGLDKEIMVTFEPGTFKDLARHQVQTSKLRIIGIQTAILPPEKWLRWVCTALYALPEVAAKSEAC